MALRFEFDQANKVLLLRLEGQLLDESVEESYREIRKYWTTTGACKGIVDFSAVTEFALSGKMINSDGATGTMHAGRDEVSSSDRRPGGAFIWCS